MGKDKKDEKKKKWKDYVNNYLDLNDRIMDVVGFAKNIKDIKIHGPISYKIYRQTTHECIVKHQGPFMADPSNIKYIYLRVNLGVDNSILEDQFKKTIAFYQEYSGKSKKRYREDRIKIEKRIKELASQGLKYTDIAHKLHDEGLVERYVELDSVRRRVDRYLKKIK